jgi:hypothetical protein
MPIQTTASRLGQVNLANDADSLFLKVFSGEIISVFEETNLMLPLTKVRTISSGKSATFAVTGVATAGYHTPGESVLTTGASTGYLSGVSGGATYGSAIATDTGSSKYLSRLRHNEKIIFIDDVLLSSAFVADIDELKNHYDVRSTYSKEIGRALAIATDKNLIRTVIAGARRGTDRFGGSTAKFLGSQVDLDADNSGITAEDIVIGLFKAAQKMDEADVPSDGRTCILTPEMYYLLVRGDSSKIGIAINKDYGGAGSLAGGTVVEVAGIKIMKSNHLPTANESSTEDSLAGAAGVKNNVLNADNSGTAGYSGLNYSGTRGIVFHTDAVGTVKLMDLSVESEYQMDRLGTLMLAKYAMGHNVLREECCIELVA